MLKPAPDPRIGLETQDRADAASETLPETMGEGIERLLDQQRLLVRRTMGRVSGFDLSTLRRQLAALAKLRAVAVEIAKVDKRRVPPPGEQTAEARAIHLSEVLTPPGWRGTIRAEFIKLRDSYFDEFELNALRDVTKKKGPKATAARGDEDIQADFIAVDQLLTDLETVESKGRAARTTAMRAMAVGMGR